MGRVEANHVHYRPSLFLQIFVFWWSLAVHNFEILIENMTNW